MMIARTMAKVLPDRAPPTRQTCRAVSPSRSVASRCFAVGSKICIFLEQVERKDPVHLCPGLFGMAGRGGGNTYLQKEIAIGGTGSNLVHSAPSVSAEY